MMVKKIYKYEIPADIDSGIQMPWGAEILDVQIQAGNLVLWAVVDPDKDNLIRNFKIFGTGWSLPHRFSQRYKHLKTIQDGSLVWHIFEVIGA